MTEALVIVDSLSGNLSLTNSRYLTVCEGKCAQLCLNASKTARSRVAAVGVFVEREVIE